MNLKNEYKRVYDLCDKEIADHLIFCKKNEEYDENFWQLTETIDKRILKKIKEDFEYVDPLYGDGWVVKAYGDGQKKRGMKLHIDNINWGSKGKIRDVENRVVTVSMGLNSNFLGGEFLLEKKKFLPKIGQAIIVDSSLPHGCSDVINGIRYVFLSWYRNTPRPDGDVPWHTQFLGSNKKIIN